MIAKTQEEIDGLRAAGKLLAQALRNTAALVKPGVNTAELDLAAEKFIRDAGAEPAFLDYKPEGASYAFPAALCVSVNDEVVHGVPSARVVLREGDILSVDVGVLYRGYYGDTAENLALPV